MTRRQLGWAPLAPNETEPMWDYWRPTLSEVWMALFPRFTQDFQRRYWHKRDASFRAAKRMGYRFIRTRLTSTYETLPNRKEK